MKPTKPWARAHVLASLGAALLCITSQSANAIPMPASIAGDLAFNLFPPGPIHVTTFGHEELTGLGGGQVQLDSGLTPAPFLSATALAVPTNFFGRAAAILQYDLEIVGPAGIVPTFLSAIGQVSGAVNLAPPGDIASGMAMRALWGLDNLATGEHVSDGGIATPQITGAFSDSFDDLMALDLTANQTYRVTLLADVGIRGGSASAFVDPVFTFGAGVGSEYSFLFSEGVGNIREVEAPPTTSVPEPGTFALLLTGLLPLALRRRRQQPGALASS